MPESIVFTDDPAGVAAAKGFSAAAAAADIRSKGDGRLDIGIVYSETPCAAAGVFTRNRVKAAPVLECQRILELGTPIHGVIANSGNANACTGDQGKRDAKSMAADAARACSAPADSFLVCSTGRIGELLQMDKIASSIGPLGAAAKRGARDGDAFSRSILTSDTKPKTCAATFQVAGRTVTVAGSAKGAGMIQPNMATMLAFVTTDIAAESAALQPLLRDAVKTTFNAITVDGDMSTNDTVILLANGASSVALDEKTLPLFRDALTRVCDRLADKIVSDGERISKVVELMIRGAASEEDAERVARAVGNSLLVKTSWFGNDPNWGRLMDALGYAEAQIDPDVIDISYGNVAALVSGTPIPENKPKWKEVVSARRFAISIDLKQGDAAYRLRATDLTEGYVNFNKSE